MVGVLLEGDQAVVIPAGEGVHAVADIGGGIGGPGFVRDDVLTNGEIGREGKQLVPVRNGGGGGDLEGLVVESLDVQLGVLGGLVGPDIVITVNNLEHVAVVGSQLLRSGALPGKGKVVRGHGLTVGPDQTIADGVGVGDGAVLVHDALHELLGGVRHDDQVAVGILRPSGQAGEQVGKQRRAVNSGVEGGVDGVGLGSQAHGDGAAGRSVSRLGGTLRSGLLLAAAGRQCKDHGEDQDQCGDSFLHCVRPFLNRFN